MKTHFTNDDGQFILVDTLCGAVVRKSPNTLNATCFVNRFKALPKNEKCEKCDDILVLYELKNLKIQ